VFDILRAFSTMNRLLLLPAMLAIAFAGFARAQSDDPSEVFLKAYMTSQQGEKLEHDGQLDNALAKFRFAGSLLEELKKGHGDWQPAIVEYRSKKIGDSILRVEGKMSTQKDLAATRNAEAGPVNPPILPGNGSPAAEQAIAQSTAPALPQGSGAPEPNAQIVIPREDAKKAAKSTSDKPAAQVSDDAISKTTKQLRDKVDQLQAELQKSKKEFTAVQKEKETLNSQLKDTNSRLQKAQGEIEKAQAAEKQVRGQLAAAQESLDKIKAGGENNSKAQEALKGEIAQLKKALASAEDGRVAAEKQRDESSAKLTDANAQLASITKQRDELVAQLKAGKDAEQHVQELVAQNSDLTQKLAVAEKTIHDIGEGKPEEVAQVRLQVEQLRQQLADKEKQNKEYEGTVTDLRSQLDESTAELNKAKLAGANTEESERLTKENDLLRNIVVRERQEEARREQAKKLMLAEFDKLQIRSETLTKQVELLAQPVTKLSPEELALLRQPVVAISDNNPAALKASFSVPKQAPPVKVENAAPNDKQEAPAPKKSAPPTQQQTADSSVQTMPKPAVPDDLVPVARQAKVNFDEGKYRAAEKQYQEILAKAPNNLYALSNLGVVYFRTGKLKAAELTLKKAVGMDAKDEFSHRTLGIVYYSESKFDDAVTELTRALAINPKSYVAHNYLGITASQKGWQEAAEKEMNEAIAANPDYADAHYNLAVIYATAQPPSKELAKTHYSKATQLGAEADPSLEKLLR
jgi:Flp pilus assembly protein TadD/predicted  nucleic acid-binding Zn-ribbon protein